MKIQNLFIIAFILIAIQCTLYAGTAYYVDPSEGTNGDGTYASPWNNIGSVNNYIFNTGDDVYFKENTICSVSSTLNINWDGNPGDRAVIGCYDGENDFDCTDGSLNRPIFDGNNMFPNNWNKFISGNNRQYVTVEYLSLRNSGHTCNTSDLNGFDFCGNGITFFDSDNIIIQHNHTFEIGLIHLGVYRTDNSLVQYNTTDTNYIYDCIDINSAFQDGQGINNMVQNNTLINCKEGIGLYKSSSYNTVQYNELFFTSDAIRSPSYQIYNGSRSHHNVIRYNSIYVDNTITPDGWGIVAACEDWTCQRPDAPNYCNKNVDIYGNFVAAVDTGIAMETGLNDCTGDKALQTDIKIYNNTLIDNKWNYRFFRTVSGSSIDIKNNISWTITSGDSSHSNNYNPVGVVWSHNLFDESVSGNAMTNAVIGNPAIVKASGWRNLSPGSLTPEDFKLSSTASAAYNSGIDLGGSPYNLDYWGTNRDSNAPWDIGAHEYTNWDTTPPAKPTGLVMIE